MRDTTPVVIMRDTTPEEQMRAISLKIQEQRIWDVALQKLDRELVIEASRTLQKGMKYMVSVKEPEPSILDLVKQQIKYTGISLFKHLDESGFTEPFCQVAPFFQDFSFEEGSHLLLDDIHLFEDLGFPPNLWKAYCTYVDEHKQDYFLKMKKSNLGFKFTDLIPILKAKMELENDPIRKMSPFNWSCAIATGLGVIVVGVNLTAAVPTAGVAVASVVAGATGLGYSAGGGGKKEEG